LGNQNNEKAPFFRDFERPGYHIKGAIGGEGRRLIERADLCAPTRPKAAFTFLRNMRRSPELLVLDEAWIAAKVAKKICKPSRIVRT
jgi:hypothetical protein